MLRPSYPALSHVCVVKLLFLEDINFLSKINLHRGVIEGAMIIKIEIDTYFSLVLIQRTDSEGP